MRQGNCNRFAFGVSIIALVTAVPAVAQDRAAQLADQDGATSSPEIVVTAQRRTETLQNVPMSVSVVTPQTLADAGVISIGDLSQVTTGYQLGQFGSVPQPTIRGVSTSIAANFENNVAIYFDGVYQANPAIAMIDLPNISSVQILKGPQGALYGRNATGGAILIDTSDPSNLWKGKAEVTYARFEDVRASAAVSGPISDRIGVALAGYVRDSGGFIHRMSRTNPGAHDGRAYGLDQQAFRAKLRFDLASNFDATLGYSYIFSNDHGKSMSFAPVENVSRTFLAAGGNTKPTVPGEAAYNLDQRNSVEQHEVSLKLNLDLGNVKIRSISAFQDIKTRYRFDFDGSYVPLLFLTVPTEEKSYQESLDVNFKVGDLMDVVVGGQYFRLDTNLHDSNTYFGPAIFRRPYDVTVDNPLSDYTLSNANNLRRRKNAWALFADANVNLAPSLVVTLGGRYSHEKQKVTTFSVNGAGAVTSPLTTVQATFKKFTPRAAIRYSLSPVSSIYASFSRGFKSGEYPSGVGNLKPVKQEVADSYEIGFKSVARGLRINLAGFYTDFSNLQVSQTQFVNNNVLTVLQNAPKAKIYGIEGDVSWEAVDHLNLRAGGSWLHARYGKGFTYGGLAVSPSGTVGATGCGTVATAQGCGGIGINANSDPLKTYLNVNAQQDLGGKQLIRSPDWSAFVGFDYLIPMGEGGIKFAGNLKYTDSYIPSNPSIWGGKSLLGSGGVSSTDVLAGTTEAGRSGEQRFVQKGYVLINGSVTWTDPSDTYFVRIWGNNLTDKRYLSHYSGTTSFGSYANQAEPRTYGVTVGARFGGGG